MTGKGTLVSVVLFVAGVLAGVRASWSGAVPPAGAEPVLVRVQVPGVGWP